MALLNPAVGSHNRWYETAHAEVGRFLCRVGAETSQPYHTIILITVTLRMTALDRACKLLLWSYHRRRRNHQDARRRPPACRCRSATLHHELEFRHGWPRGRGFRSAQGGRPISARPRPIRR